MPGHLLTEQGSAYLRARAEDPVEWMPWGSAALERARRENKPIFLSSGYATCSWCHTMGRESFADPIIAERMNCEFVNIQLDKEELPEVDEIYMAATQLLTHSGGWPNSVFLTPSLEPYFAGTYFPPEDRPEVPSFRTVLESMAHAFRERRAEVETQARELVDVMRRYLGGHPSDPENAGSSAVERATGGAFTHRALRAMDATFDRAHGGFGGAPRFPRPAQLLLLLDLAESDHKASVMLDITLDAMARGGLFDHLGGGFHRHSRDVAWRVPSFEKTLTDNGILLEIYARRQRRVPAAELARVVRRTADFITSDLTHGDGGFCLGLDGSIHGHEGAYYTWSQAEIASALGVEDAGFLAPLLGFDGAPNFAEDFYVLYRPKSLREQAARRKMTLAAIMEEEAPLLDALLAARRTRERPATDTRRHVGANGLAFSGLAAAAEALGDATLLGRASEAASCLLEGARSKGCLARSWSADGAGPPALLGDYVCLARGLLELHRVSGEGRWLDAAEEITAEQVERLRDPDGGFFNSEARPDLIVRARECFDGALPSANGLAMLNLLDISRRRGAGPWLELAQTTLGSLSGVLAERAEGTWTLALAAHRLLAPKSQNSPEKVP